MINWWIAIQAASSSIAGALVGCALYNIYCKKRGNRAISRSDKKTEMPPPSGTARRAATAKGIVTKRRNIQVKLLRRLEKMPRLSPINASELARVAGVSDTTISRLVASSGIPTTKRGRAVVFLAGSLLTIVKQRLEEVDYHG